MIKLKQNITIEEIQKYSFTYDSLIWSKNSYCIDRITAEEQEVKFLKTKTNSAITLNEIVRPTAKGFFADISYTAAGGETNSVVVYLPMWMCNLDYKPEINYIDNTNYDVRTFLNCYSKKVPDASDVSGKALVNNIWNIETKIPLPDGQFISGGPKRVAIFYLNYKLEVAIVAASKEGELKGLDINQLSMSDNTHITFHQGAGNKLPDLTDGYSSYEVKGPLTNIENIKTNIRSNKGADYILRLSNNKLTKYIKTEDSYIEQASIPFEFNYEVLLEGTPDSWEAYNSLVNN